MMVDMAGKRRKWEMANGNESWIHPATQRYIDIIYDFLEQKTKETLKKTNGKRRPWYSYNQIAKQTGIPNRAIRMACDKLAYKEVPFLKVRAIRYVSKQGVVRTSEKVELIRFAESSKDLLPDQSEKD